MKRSHVQRNISGWWFQTCFIFHFIYGIIPTPLTNSYFSRRLLHHQTVCAFRYWGTFHPVWDLSPSSDFLWDSQVDIKHRTSGQFHRRIPVRNCSFVIAMNPFWLHNCCNLDRFMTNHGIILLIEGDSGSDANVQLSWVNCWISSLKRTKTWHVEVGEESPINPYYPHETRSGKSTTIIG